MRAIPTTVAAVAALWAAGCGSVENPDLATGTVTGRISNASPGAYAYVLGYPDAHASIAADGSFRIDTVPAGQRTVVVYDGGDGAGTVDVRVEGATVSDTPPTGPLPQACAVLAAAVLAGAQPTGLGFSVDGALLRAADGTTTLRIPGPSALLFPLPAGTWTLRADQPGFTVKAQVLYGLTAGQSWPVDVSLDVESSSDYRGCVSSGCESPLACDAGDGRCYQCTSAADCAGAPCTDHVCVTSPPPGGLGMCQACQQPGDCKPGPLGAAQPPACVVPSGATVGYCSYDCGQSPNECPAGYRYDDVPAGMTGNPAKACLARDSCLAMYTTFGATCATDSACSTALDGGKCWRPSGTSDYTAGVCSAPCSLYASCPPWLAGWTCDAATQYCRPP